MCPVMISLSATTLVAGLAISQPKDLRPAATLRSSLAMQYGQDSYAALPGDYDCGQAVWQVCGVNGCITLGCGQQQILGRFDMGQTKGRPAYYVSRQQCLLSINFDGSASLTSLGKPPTGWRSVEGEPWQWLRKDKGPILMPNGFQLSLNKYDKDGAKSGGIFNCLPEGLSGYQQQGYGLQASYGQSGGYGQQSGYDQQGEFWQQDEYEQQGGYDRGGDENYGTRDGAEGFR